MLTFYKYMNSKATSTLTSLFNEINLHFSDNQIFTLAKRRVDLEKYFTKDKFSIEDIVKRDDGEYQQIKFQEFKRLVEASGMQLHDLIRNKTHETSGDLEEIIEPNKNHLTRIPTELIEEYKQRAEEHCEFYKKEQELINNLFPVLEKDLPAFFVFEIIRERSELVYSPQNQPMRVPLSLYTGELVLIRGEIPCHIAIKGSEINIDTQDLFGLPYQAEAFVTFKFKELH